MNWIVRMGNTGVWMQMKKLCLFKNGQMTGLITREIIGGSDVSSLSFSGFGRARAFHFLNFSGFGRTRVPTFRARAGFEFIKRASGGYWAFTTSKHNYFFHNLRKAKTQFIKIYKVWVMKSFLEKFFCINLLNKQNYSMLQILEL